MTTCDLIVGQNGITIMTVTCDGCHHSRATDLDALPPAIQERVRTVMRDR